MSGELAFRRAERDVDRHAVYRLRYRVYVEEWGHEDPDDHPDGLEQDEHDRSSVHFMAHRDRELVGTVRLIRRSASPFPLELHCPPRGDPLGALGDRVAEISRLAVSKRSRRRAAGSPAPEGGATAPRCGEERRGQAIVLGLFKAVYQESRRLGLTHVCAAMERSLVHLLRRSCIAFEQIGPEVAYHGCRAPYLMEIARFDREWHRHRPELFREFAAEPPPPLRDPWRRSPRPWSAPAS